MNDVTVSKKRPSPSKLFVSLRGRVQKGLTTFLVSFFKSKSFPYLGVSSGLAVVPGEEKILFSPLNSQRDLPLTIEKHGFGVFTKHLTARHPAPSIVKVANAIATKSGANPTLDGKFIQQLYELTDGNSINDHQLFRLSSKRIVPSIRVSAEPVITLAFHWQGSLYHWMFDTLPKLYLLENAHIPVKRLYVDCGKNFQRESLDLLGFGPNRVIDASQVEALSASELIIPSMPGFIGHPPKWVCDYLRSVFLPLASESLAPPLLQRKKQMNTYGGDRGERIFLKNTSSLSPLLSALLEKYRFNVVNVADLEFIEQVRLFSSVSMIISYHQPELAHLVFAKPSTKVLELFTGSDINPCHWTVSNEVGVNYHYLSSAEQNEERLEQAILNLINEMNASSHR